VWLKYARWLAAGLTFQLAGDIVHNAVAPTWDDIGRLAAIAVIPDVLDLFPRARHQGTARAAGGTRDRKVVTESLVASPQDWRTPSLDSLAKEGIRFADSYAETSCTAGRTAFIKAWLRDDAREVVGWHLHC
jgi:uncharacterized protein DUF1622